LSGLVVNGSFLWGGTGVWDVSVDARMNMRLKGGIDRLLGGNFGELTAAADDQIGQVADQFNNAGRAYVDAQAAARTFDLILAATPLAEGLTLLNREDVQEKVRFSLRTSEDLHLEGDQSLELPQWRWQQFALSLGQGKTWEEPEVEFDGQPYLPWPGLALWTEEERHLTAPLAGRFFNGRTAVSEDDAGELQTVELQKKILAESYLVNTL
jgi:hypothetical protein